MSRAMRIALFAAVAIVVATNGWWARERTEGGDRARAEDVVAVPAPASEELPPEALATLAAIAHDGPFPYDRDGTVFQNREGLLPQRPRGYYREYTVETPGARDRGARRIVAGGDPPEVYYYTEDHYRSFRRIEGAPP